MRELCDLLTPHGVLSFTDSERGRMSASCVTARDESDDAAGGETALNQQEGELEVEQSICELLEY